MKNILIIGCGLIGSSLLRAIVKKKISEKIFVYEKSKINIQKIKKLKLPCVVINDFKNVIPKSDLIIFCTPMSEYEKIILKINKYLLPKTIITDDGSSKAMIIVGDDHKIRIHSFAHGECLYRLMGKPVELYSSIQHSSLDDAEKFLEDFSEKIICDLGRMDEVDIL